MSLPTTSVQTYNKLRSTWIYGNLVNVDNSTKSVLAGAGFQRNVTIGGSLILGTETLDYQTCLLWNSFKRNFLYQLWNAQRF